MSARHRAIRAVAYVMGGIFILLAAIVFMAQVKVTSEAGLSRPCGSAFDVAVGRVGWPEWWSQDLGDPEVVGGDTLVRSEKCPDAINRQQLIAGLWAFGALLVVGLAELARYLLDRGSGTDHESFALTRLGSVVAVVGGALLVAGIAGVVLLIADPDDTLFLFVSRPTVALIGLVLLLPAVVLVIAGVVLRLTGRRLEALEDAVN